ncbi:MAG TPA: RidA family protein [Acidobacteriaceae bacterium]|nr:RidA family protein [Acidobacteriaceae bacterium]
MRDPLRRYPCVVLCFLLAAGSAQLLAQAGGAIKVIQVGGDHIGSTSSAGILVNRTLYVTGQDGRDSSGEIPKVFQKEVRQSLNNVRDVLRAAGMDFGNVVWINIYMTHISDIDGMNKIYWKMIGTDPPARTVLGVASLPNGENIEINCIAVSSAARRRVIHPAGWPQGPHINPAGIEADDVLYMSAQSGVDPLTGKLAADYAGEVKQALDNVAAVAKAANMSMANVIWVNPYLSSDSGPEHVMNKIYATYFEFGNTPGRGTIQVVDLPNHAHIVFSCIAGADLSKRMSIRPRNEKPSPTASPGILYGDTLYLSAKDAYVPGLGLFSPELGIQVRMSMRSLLDGLQKADMDFSNVVSSTIYLRDVKDENPVVSLYGTFFKDNFPARTTLQQNFDMKSEDVEQISFIAVRQPIH